MTDEKTVVNPKPDKVFVRIPQPISALINAIHRFINAFRRLCLSVTGNRQASNLSSPAYRHPIMDWIDPQPYVKVNSVKHLMLRTGPSTVTFLLQSWQEPLPPINSPCNQKFPIFVGTPTTWDEKLYEYGIYPSPDRRMWYGQISVDSLVIPIKIKKIGRKFELYAQNLPDWVTKEGPHHLCFFEKENSWHFVHVVETDKYDPVAQIHALMGYIQYGR